MTTTTRNHPTSLKASRARRPDHPPAWDWHKLTFLSTCPRCGHERLQRGYTRRNLLKLLGSRRKIDGYCIVCNVCWEISESERRAIAPQ